MKKHFTIFTALTAFIMLGTTSYSQNFYCVQSPDGEAHILTIDISDGTLIDSVGVNITNDVDGVDGFNGMAKDPISGNIYVIVKDASGDKHLGTINPVSGDITSVGLVSLPVSSIAFDAVGNLYGMRGSGSTELHSIDKTDGTNIKIHDFVTAGDDGEAISVNTTDGLLYRYDGGSSGTLTTLNLTSFVETDILTLSGIDTWGPALYYNNVSNDFILAAGATFYTLATNGTTTELGNISALSYPGNFKGIVPVGDPNSVESNQMFADINVYPNPSTGNLIISTDKKYNLEVLDLTGKVIQKHYNASSINIETAGVYFLRFTNLNNSFVQKVIIK